MSHTPLEDLSRQALGRPLTEAEIGLAEALGRIFSTGEHDLTRTAEQLEAAHVPLPSGAQGRWTLATLEAELKQINASLDAAHESGGFMPLA